MRKFSVLFLLSILTLIPCNASPPPPDPPQNNQENNFIAPEGENYWRSVAAAKYILVANNSELAADNAKTNEYYEYNIHINKPLKGNAQENIRFKVYMRENNYNFINSLDKSGKAILFIVSAYDGYGINNYLADYYIENAIIIHTEAAEEVIRNEIELQNNIINDKLYESFAFDNKLYRKVNNYIRNTKNILIEHISFRKLEAMGENAVPYIILLLDNFEKLPIKSISLTNKSEGAFEGMRHYGPELVIDALTAILNQITGEAFGTIYNGDAGQEERILALNGWRIYLYKIYHRGI
jgi:hypothetical protein